MVIMLCCGLLFCFSMLLLRLALGRCLILVMKYCLIIDIVEDMLTYYGDWDPASNSDSSYYIVAVVATGSSKQITCAIFHQYLNLKSHTCWLANFFAELLGSLAHQLACYWQVCDRYMNRDGFCVFSQKFNIRFIFMELSALFFCQRLCGFLDYTELSPRLGVFKCVVC